MTSATRPPATARSTTPTISPAWRTTRPVRPFTASIVASTRRQFLPPGQHTQQIASDRDRADHRFPGHHHHRAAVRPGHHVRIENPGQGLDVTIAASLGERGDHPVTVGALHVEPGLPTDVPTGRGGQLSELFRCAADDVGDLGEGHAEHVVQDEADPFGRAELLHRHQQGHGHRLVERHDVGRVGGLRTPGTERPNAPTVPPIAPAARAETPAPATRSRCNSPAGRARYRARPGRSG